MKYDKESMRQLFEIDVKKRLAVLESKNKVNPLEKKLREMIERVRVLEGARKVQIRLNAGFAKKTIKAEKELKQIWKWW